jgi:acetolactate synthase-1/2/3 large subunit
VRHLSAGRAAPTAHIGFNDLHASAWVQHHPSLEETDARITADTRVAPPMLLEPAEQVAADVPERGQERRRWRAQQELHDAEAIREIDWVLTAGTLNDWALRLWDFDLPYSHHRGSLGTATQIGSSLGVALAHRGAGRLVVDLAGYRADRNRRIGGSDDASRYRPAHQPRRPPD